MKLAPLVIGAVMLAGACRGGPRVDGATDAAAPAASSAVVGDPQVRSPSQEGVLVMISKTQILVGDAPQPVVLLDEPRERGIDARYKRGDLFIVPLGAALVEARAGEKQRLAHEGTPDATVEAIVVAHRSTPYRIIVEVLYTLGQSEFGKYHLMGIAEKRDKAPPLPAKEAPVPAVPRDIGAPGKALSFRVQISREGISVSASGGALGAGCGVNGAGITLPKRGETHDLAGLTACARGVKRALPEHAMETQVKIGASPEIAYGLVLDVIDALRSDREGDLFPDTSFMPP